MAGRRLHVAVLPESGGVVVLEAEQAHHARVLRLAVGDPITLFDGEGREAAGEITALTPHLECQVGVPHEAHATRPRVVLVQALPKGAKLETIVRMGTETGADEFALVETSRAVVKHEPSRWNKKHERLARVAQEASRQSLRASTPLIHEPRALLAVAKEAPSDALKLMCVPGPTDAAPWWSRLDDQSLAANPPMWIVVGPEGGLSPEEIEALSGLGYTHHNLGPHVLRVETAAPVAVASCLQAFDLVRGTRSGRAEAT